MILITGMFTPLAIAGEEEDVGADELVGFGYRPHGDGRVVDASFGQALAQRCEHALVAHHRNDPRSFALGAEVLWPIDQAREVEQEGGFDLVLVP